MSKATKRKYVTRAVVEDEVRPTGDQVIVKVTCGRGSNLHEVEAGDGSKFLVSMPTKFRKNVWIKRGDYVVVEPISEGNKVRGEIVHILYPMQIKALKQENLWPVEFSDSATVISSASAITHSPATPTTPSPDALDKERTSFNSDYEQSSSDEELFRNTNHPAEIIVDSTSSDESS